MELGEKIRAARLEAGLSQRQLCGTHMTRNMLSQIENGSARPSMNTLRYLAGQLGKSVSYFLEEEAVTSPNLKCMTQAREAWAAGDSRRAQELLSGFREPDGVFSEERQLLGLLCLLQEAQNALAHDRVPYAQSLLTQAEQCRCIYDSPLQRRLAVLKARAGMAVDGHTLADDEALLLRAKLSGDPNRQLALLEACEALTPEGHLLAGNAHLALKDYAAAAKQLQQAEDAFPQEACAGLEVCYRELGDYKLAYEYAVRRRQ